MDIRVLEEYGINYKSGLERFLGDVELYEMVLDAFLKDTTLEKAKNALEEKDYKQLFEFIHQLKGSSGSSDMIELYNASCKLVELLRNDVYDEERIYECFFEVESSYIRTKEGITKARKVHDNEQRNNTSC